MSFLKFQYSGVSRYMGMVLCVRACVLTVMNSFLSQLSSLTASFTLPSCPPTWAHAWSTCGRVVAPDRHLVPVLRRHTQLGTNLTHSYIHKIKLGLRLKTGFLIILMHFGDPALLSGSSDAGWHLVKNCFFIQMIHLSTKSYDVTAYWNRRRKTILVSRHII